MFDKCNSRNYTMEVGNISKAMVQRWVWHGQPQDPVRKGEAIPAQAWKGPEVSRRMRVPDLMTIST
jgi:hypothetical protein